MALRFLRSVFVAVIFLFVLSFPAFANNLTVQNVSLEKRSVGGSVILVEFDISWDNSWRHTENYDAVWLVFKASIASAGLTPCTVYPTASQYDIGNTVGSNDDMEFIFTDYTGVFIQRKVTGSGTASTTDAALSIICNASSSQTISVKVIGIEMVYIPTSPFYAGDPLSSAGLRKGPTDADPWYIESESTITTTNAAGGSYRYSSAGNTNESATGAVFDINYQFPKGYEDFYCMKYPVTEGQYVEFQSNLLAAAYETARDVSASSGKASDSVVKRNTFSFTSGTSSSSREDRAMSYLSWMDLAAYLDWVALRPMTELEYEKVARGPLLAVPGEYAWGSSSLPQSGITFAGSPEDGNETFVAVNVANTNYNSTTFSQGDQHLGSEYRQGPVRPGIFATSTSTRERAGAGYYGVMDLSGNLTEWVVTIGNTWGRNYYPTHGDGSLSSNSGTEGNADQIAWPGLNNGGIAGVTADDGMGSKGGYWSSTSAKLRTSDRQEAAKTFGGIRDNYLGGRGVRSATTLYTFTCDNDNIVEWPEQCDDANETPGDFCDMCVCESEDSC